MSTESERPTSGEGVDIGQGEPTTFEPEEDPDAVDEPDVADDLDVADEPDIADEHSSVRTEAETGVDDAAGQADDPGR